MIGYNWQDVGVACMTELAELFMQMNQRHR